VVRRNPRSGCRAADRTHVIEADTVVVAVGEKSINELYGKVHGKVPEVYLVGDSVKSRKVMDAIEDGAYVGLQI